MKLCAPATERNRSFILAVLERVLPARGAVLEIASGSGQHAVHFATRLPGVTWQPSDVSPEAVTSIEAWRTDAGPANLAAPVLLDVCADPWPVSRAEAVVNINMIHISPWEACRGLMAGAGRALPPGGVLYLYGPFLVQGRPTAPSNEAFDRSLRASDPSWGVRWLHEVAAEAEGAGLDLEETVDMPANNLSVIFRRRS